MPVPRTPSRGIACAIIPSLAAWALIGFACIHHAPTFLNLAHRHPAASHTPALQVESDANLREAS